MTEKQEIYVSDMIDLYHDIKDYLKDLGVHILDDENKYTVSEFCDLINYHFKHKNPTLNDIQQETVMKENEWKTV